MKKKLGKIYIIIICIAVIICYAFYAYDQMQPKTYIGGEVTSFKEIPHIGLKIKQINNAKRIKYYSVKTYRDNYFYITGYASTKDIENWIEQYQPCYVWKEGTEPRYIEEEILRKYDPEFMHLSEPYWWVSYSPEKQRIYNISMNYHPQTEKFWIFIIQTGHKAEK